MAKDPKLKFIIEIDEKGRPVLKNVGQDFDRLERRARKTGGAFQALKANWLILTAAFAAGLYTLAKVTKGILRLAEVYGVQESAENALAVAMRNTGTYTVENIEHLKRYASQLQEVTTYGDEVTLSTMANLQAYGMNIETLERATKATMDLATAKKIDLRTASELVGKAFVGETGTLSRYGIVLDENVPKGEKFTAVLQLINERFGSAAQAEIDTYAGKIAQLANVWGDLKEAAGAIVVPVLEVIVVTLTNIIKRTRDWAENNRRAAQDIVVNGLAPIIEGLGFLTYAIQAVGETWIGWKEIIRGLRVLIAELFEHAIGWIRKFLESVNFRGVFDDWISGMRRVEMTWSLVAENQSRQLDALIAKHEGMREVFRGIRGGIEEVGVAIENVKWAELSKLLAFEGGGLPSGAGVDEERERLEKEARRARLERMAAEYEQMTEMRARLSEMYYLSDLEDIRIAQETAAMKRQTMVTYAAFAATMATTLYALTNNQSKAIFLLVQAAAFAEAIIRAHLAFMQALTTPPGPPFTLPLAKAMLLLGYAQAAAIAATAIKGVSGGGGGGTQGSYGVAGGAAVTGGPAAGLAREAETEQGAIKIDVTIIGEFIRAEEAIEEALIPILKKVGDRDTEISISYRHD